MGLYIFLVGASREKFPTIAVTFDDKTSELPSNRFTFRNISERFLESLPRFTLQEPKFLEHQSIPQRCFSALRQKNYTPLHLPKIFKNANIKYFAILCMFQIYSDDTYAKNFRDIDCKVPLPKTPKGKQ